MPKPQNFKNHARFRPLFHYVLVPLLLVNLFFSIVLLVHHYAEHPHVAIWWVVLAVVLILIAVDHRTSALGAQDRIIRLEERLRLIALGVSHTTIYALTERQLIGLRFASDSELPVLAERAVREKLTEKQIKASIQSWRADYFRI
ncbi:MAG TPA: DUF6526 family protein [Acidobacteriaceae bacterium]|jgi:hypothetical protein|nr:DUF6526 family protein [Acidobacteriaceae bacterium]